MRNRLAATALAAVALATGAAVAEAAIKKGTYAGKLSGGGTIALTVTKTQKVVKVVRNRLTLTCSDGDTFTSGKLTATGSVDIATGRFELSDTKPDDAQDWKLTGTVKGAKITGTYRHDARFGDGNIPDEHGSVSCTTGDLTYTAKLPKKKP